MCTCAVYLRPHRLSLVFPAAGPQHPRISLYTSSVEQSFLTYNLLGWGMALGNLEHEDWAGKYFPLTY